MRFASYKHGSYLNAKNIKYDPANFLDAALAGTGETVNGGGPIWAIFDADAAKREQWTVEPPYVDIAEGYFFSANPSPLLAAAIVNKYQRKPISGATLESTVTRYNSFVDRGNDADFGKPAPKYKIQTPPFYAAWAMPVVHDTRAGLRINAKCQVMDFSGNVIPGLYCGGESAGGFSLHGLARCIVQGRIAGRTPPAKQPRFQRPRPAIGKVKVVLSSTQRGVNIMKTTLDLLISIVALSVASTSAVAQAQTSHLREKRGADPPAALPDLPPSHTVAPMSLLTYGEARPWAKAIKPKVEAREMPPWLIDRNVGVQHFNNEIR